MTLRRTITSFSLFMLVLLLNISIAAATPRQQQGATFSGVEHLGKPTDTSMTINVVPDEDINICWAVRKIMFVVAPKQQPGSNGVERLSTRTTRTRCGNSIHDVPLG
jgi:hypothetical protein